MLALPGRDLRQCPVNLDAVHHPGRRGGPAGAPAGPQAGAALHFVEHGLAPDRHVQRWQRRLEPVQRRLAGGCHLTRPVTELLTAAGFQLTELDVFYEPHAPKFLAAESLGTAIAP